MWRLDHWAADPKDVAMCRGGLFLACNHRVVSLLTTGMKFHSVSVHPSHWYREWVRVRGCVWLYHLAGGFQSQQRDVFWRACFGLPLTCVQPCFPLSWASFSVLSTQAPGGGNGQRRRKCVWLPSPGWWLHLCAMRRRGNVFCLHFPLKPCCPPPVLDVFMCVCLLLTGGR